MGDDMRCGCGHWSSEHAGRAADPNRACVNCDCDEYLEDEGAACSCGHDLFFHDTDGCDKCACKDFVPV
jgi:hypothetical protein